MDKLGNTGMHMMKSSMPMFGSKLHLEQISENSVGLGATYRWHGNMLFMKMDFTVKVTRWIVNSEKVWETIGNAKMIILAWYRMRLEIIPAEENSRANLSIDYTLPQNIIFRFPALFLAPWYANWCLNNMLEDSKMQVEQNRSKSQ